MGLFQLVPTIVWFVPLALQALIAAVMIRRGLVRVFPVFFSYTVFVSSRDVFLLLFLPSAGNRYATVFWWGDAIAILLSLGVIVETLKHLFQPYPFLHFIFRLVWIAAAISAAIALALFHTSTLKGSDRVLEAILLMERSARLMQVCLLIVLISLMSRLGLTWQHYALGIAAGFGLYAALDLALLQFRPHLHSPSDASFALLGSTAYNLAVLVWAHYFLKPRSGRSPVDRLPSTDLASWNDALAQHTDKWYRP